MKSESQEVKMLFNELCAQPKRSFPQYRQPLDASSKPGVYIIRKEETVLHVGRTLRGRDGIHQRLKNHLHGSSSFTNEYLKGNGAILREDACTYQYLELEDPRKRALLEALAVGTLCPKHIGLGE
jgi:excinuclease UvrABC nuclease subunit